MLIDEWRQVKGTTPFDLANEFARPELAELLMSYAQMFDSQFAENVETGTTSTTLDPSTNDNNSVLADFYSKYNQEFVNLDLVVEVLDFVDNCSTPGPFLPFHFQIILRILPESGFFNLLNAPTFEGIPFRLFRSPDLAFSLRFFES